MTPAEPGEEDASERPLRETRRLLGPTLLALLAFALLALLGFWQLGRDAERNQDWRATQEDGAQPALGQATGTRSGEAGRERSAQGKLLRLRTRKKGGRSCKGKLGGASPPSLRVATLHPIMQEHVLLF